MMPTHECVVGRTPAGVVCVDGKPYPMASEVYATESDIQRSIQAMARQLASHYNSMSHLDTSPAAAAANTGAAAEAPISYDNPLVIISILKGSYIFTADMVRYMNDAGLPNVCDFMRVSSYNSGTASTGTVHMHATPKYENLKGKHVLVLEDVCDSGRTLTFLKKWLTDTFDPKSVSFCVLVNKQADARKVAFQPEFSCMRGPNKYIIGYGFEVNDRYRDFRHVFVLKDGEAGRFPTKL